MASSKDTQQPLFRRGLRWLSDSIGSAIADGARFARPRMPYIAALAILAYVLLYLSLVSWFPEYQRDGVAVSYRDSFLLRLLGMMLFVPLIFTAYWRPAWASPFALLWFVAFTYAWPFFATYMLFLNGFAEAWALQSVLGLFVMVMLLYSWVCVLFAYVIGGGAALLLYHAKFDLMSLDLQFFWPQLPVYLTALVVMILLNYRAEWLKQDRLHAMSAVGSNIAHELRTPLLGIKSGIRGLERYLPQLVAGYEAAKAEGLPVRSIRGAHLNQLRSVLRRVDAETDYSHTIINMLLLNSGKKQVDTSSYELHSICDCVDQALERYPFSSDRERGKVSWERRLDFTFLGSDMLMTHVLFNLMKNAMFFIERHGSGAVSLRTEIDHPYNRLYFRDTGPGIPPDVLLHIFERFYSTTKDDAGTGIGLAFCKMVMEGFGGRIRCHSVLGRYTEFVLEFPGVDDDKTA